MCHALVQPDTSAPLTPASGARPPWRPYVILSDYFGEMRVTLRSIRTKRQADRIAALMHRGEDPAAAAHMVLG